MLPGYKKTDVGAIPEDWDVSPLVGLTDPRRPISYGIVQTGPSVPNGVRCLRVLDIDRGRINRSALITTTSTISDAYGRTVLKCGDLVIPLRGKVGDVALVDEDLAGCNLTRGLALIAVRPDWSASFCQQSISSVATRRRLDQAMNGSALQEIPIATLRAFQIAFPPTKVEQEAIAETLSDADALIESLERLFAKKRQLKHGAMQELLTGKRRLPGFAGEWTEVALGRLGHCHRGVSYNPTVDLSPLDTESTIRLLRANNVYEARVVLDDLQYVHSRRVSDDQRLREDDILICMASGSRDLVGKAGKFTAGDGFPYTFGAFMGCFRPDYQAADPSFVYYLLQTEQYRTHIGVLLAGSSINNLTPGSVEGFLVSIPSDEAEQTAIATILSDMDTEIAALESKLAKARALKQGMMQELLTGRIRLL